MVITKLLSGYSLPGIHDENDHVYNPKIVRIGLKPHHSVKAVSMDYLVYSHSLSNCELNNE